MSESELMRKLRNTPFVSPPREEVIALPIGTPSTPVERATPRREIPSELYKTLDPFKLPRQRLHQNYTFPKVSAVYFAFSDREQILYIGSTTDLQRRWRSHEKRSRLLFAGCTYIAWYQCTNVSLETMRWLERQLIWRFSPPGNYSYQREHPRGVPVVAVLPRLLFEEAYKKVSGHYGGFDVSQMLVQGLKLFLRPEPEEAVVVWTTAYGRDE